MAEIPAAYVAHGMPGRTRLRVPAFRDDMIRLQGLALAIVQLPSVASVQASGTTASLLVHHDVALPDLLRAVSPLVKIVDAPPFGPDWSAVPVAPSVLPAAGALAAAGLAVVQLLRRDPLPPALTLGIHAVSLARKAVALAVRSASNTP